MIEYNEIEKPSFEKDWKSFLFAVVAAPLAIAAVLGVPYLLGLLFIGMSGETFGILATAASTIFLVIVLAVHAESRRTPIENNDAVDY